MRSMYSFYKSKTASEANNSEGKLVGSYNAAENALRAVGRLDEQTGKAVAFNNSNKEGKEALERLIANTKKVINENRLSSDKKNDKGLTQPDPDLNNSNPGPGFGG